MKIKIIPLPQLVPSPANVRKTDRMNGIDGTRRQHRGARACCRTYRCGEAANGKFEVVAGGRRLAALKLLAKSKALAKDAPVAATC